MHILMHENSKYYMTCNMNSLLQQSVIQYYNLMYKKCMV